MVCEGCGERSGNGVGLVVEQQKEGKLVRRTMGF